MELIIFNSGWFYHPSSIFWSDCLISIIRGLSQILDITVKLLPKVAKHSSCNCSKVSFCGTGWSSLWIPFSATHTSDSQNRILNPHPFVGKNILWLIGTITLGCSENQRNGRNKIIRVDILRNSPHDEILLIKIQR